MRYCQTCDEAQAMAHEGDHAVCPSCGATEAAPRCPLFIVTGASAVGKSTVHAPLAVSLADVAAVFDSDTLIDPFARAGGGAVDWDALLEAWVEVAHGLAQQHFATVVLCSFAPDRIERAPNRSSVSSVHHLLLDCADDVRQARLDARPAWRALDDDAQDRWSRELRAAVADHVRTDLATVDETVAAIDAWVRRHLADETSAGPGAPTTIDRARPEAVARLLDERSTDR